MRKDRKSGAELIIPDWKKESLDERFAHLVKGCPSSIDVIVVGDNVNRPGNIKRVCPITGKEIRIDKNLKCTTPCNQSDLQNSENSQPV